MISLAITVCNEHEELTNLLDFLQEHALSPQYEIIIHIDEKEPNCEHVSSALGSVLFRLTDFYFQLCASCTEASHFTTTC